MTSFVVRHRVPILAIWGMIAVGGVGAGLRIGEVLTAVTEVPGTPSAAASEALRSAFGEDATSTFLVVYRFGQADATELARMRASLQRAVDEVPTAAVQHQQAVGGVLYASVGTGLDLIGASAQTENLRIALRAQGLTGAMVTGPPALEHDVRPVLAGDLQRGGLVGLVLAVTVLVAALGTRRRVLVVLACAATTVAGSLLVVTVLAWMLRSIDVPMVLYVPNIVELVGLGLAIDYALLVVNRHRAELAEGRDSALAEAMRTAGRTVWWAGSTAAIGLAALLLIPIPLVRSLGLAGFVVPLVATLSATSLVPALLSFQSALPDDAGLLARRAPAFWAGIAQRVTTRPARALTLSLIACAVVASPLLGVSLAPASLAALPSDVPAAQALASVTERLGPGALTPHELLIRVAPGTNALDPQNERARQSLAAYLSDLPEVFGVFTDTSSAYVDAKQQYQRIFVLGRHEFASPKTAGLVADLRALRPADFDYGRGATLLVAGAAAQGVDFLDTLRSTVPQMAVVVLLLAFVVLRRLFGSARVAAVSITMNVVSLTAACGAVVAIFQFGIGNALLRTYSVPHIESWTFVFMFALLFGLTMDYQVFIVRAVREAEAHGLAPTEAVRTGVTRTGGLVTAAALAFVCALVGLMFGRIAGLQELGFGLAVGVLIDATVVRGVMLPAALILVRRR